MTCPYCIGEGCLRQVAVTTAGWMERVHDCSWCGGSGSLSEEQVERINQGARLRQDRLQRGLSQREEAERVGVTVEALSKREVGLLV